MRHEFIIENSLRRAAAVTVIAAYLFGSSISAFAQTAARQNVRTPPNPNAGWSGVINYRKTLNDSFSSDEKLLGSIDERERIKHNDTHTYDYTASMVINDTAGTGRPITATRISAREAYVDKTVQTELTNCHSWEPSRVVTATATDRKTTTGVGTGEAYSVGISVNNGRFDISFTFPEIHGSYSHSTTSSYQGLCPNSTRKPSGSNTDGETRIERGGSSVSGQVDPQNPDVLEGSKSWTEPGVSGRAGFTYTITWRLRRKPVPLMITDVHFFEPRYPSQNEWVEVSDKGRVIDGNQIKVVATIANFGTTDKTASVSFRELKENAALGEGPVSATIPANGSKDVEVIWDSSGYAWQQSGEDVVPMPGRQVEVKIPDDTMQKGVTIAPKPVLIVPGFWQSPEALKQFPGFFKAVTPKWGAWYSRTDWRKVSTDNADAIDKDVRDIQKGENAWHVDLVTVQNGGLMGRVYVNSKMPTLFDGRPAATHMVMVGVPNLGTPCAEGLTGISFRMNTFNIDAVSEVSPDSMKRFNLLVNNTNGTRFAALAVDNHTGTCFEDGIHGDGLVPVDSALWRVATHATLRNIPWNPRDILTEPTVFRRIYRWLAVPPKGEHGPDPNTLTAEERNRTSQADFRNAAFTGGPNDELLLGGSIVGSDDHKAAFSGTAKIGAHSTSDIEINVTPGDRLFINMLASPDISATLVNEAGQVEGENLAGKPEAAEIIRTIGVRHMFTTGKWHLRLTNTSNADTEAGFAVFILTSASSERIG